MRLVLAALAGAIAGRVGWLLLRPAFGAPVLQRENYRGHPLPTAAGVVVVIAVIVVEGVRAVLSAPGPARVAVVLAVAGFGALGLLDDVAGTGDVRGFRGHLTALMRGRLTTGGTKLLGGAAVAVIVAAMAGGDRGVWRLLGGAGVVALAANLGNLFDRAPGRALKVGAGAGLILGVASGAAPALTPVMVAVGASAALLPEDLGEELMLGDAGANALGGALGVGVVLVAGDTALVAILVALVLANAASEVVSFSQVIEAVPPLRAIDRAGRRHR